MNLQLQIYKKSKTILQKQGVPIGISIGIVFGLLIASCAGISFPYKYYGISFVNYKPNELLGPTKSDDLSISDCDPTTSDASPCIIMFTKEFLPMKQDYLQTKNALIECQKKVL